MRKRFPSSHAWEPLYIKGKPKNSKTQKLNKFILTELQGLIL